MGDWGLGIGDWALGIGHWGLGIGFSPHLPISPSPHAPCPMPHSPSPSSLPLWAKAAEIVVTSTGMTA